MQALHDIFSIWSDPGDPSTDERRKEIAVSRLASALNEKHDTVYRWKRRGRIPESAWLAVIEAAKGRGRALTIADMHAANRPPKARRNAHKIKPVRRREERVSS